MRGAVGVAVLVMLLVTGCASAPDGRPDPFPPRPFPIDVIELDPCRTLTPAQVEALGPGTVPRSGQPVVDGRPSRICNWYPFSSSYGFSVQTVGVDAGETVGAPNSSVESILGFGVVRAPDPDYTIPLCDYLIDAADGALLRVTVQSIDRAPDGSKTPLPLVCDKAKALAVDVLSTLRASGLR